MEWDSRAIRLTYENRGYPAKGAHAGIRRASAAPRESTGCAGLRASSGQDGRATGRTQCESWVTGRRRHEAWATGRHRSRAACSPPLAGGIGPQADTTVPSGQATGTVGRRAAYVNRLGFKSLVAHPAGSYASSRSQSDTSLSLQCGQDGSNHRASADRVWSQSIGRADHRDDHIRLRVVIGNERRGSTTFSTTLHQGLLNGGEG